MDWEPRARALARAVTNSRWHLPLAATPRHVFVPHWWEDRHLASGPEDEDRWAAATYGDQTLVTSIGGLHADHAGPDACPRGLPTSSSTLPSLVVRMYRHAHLYDGADILDVDTGSGYGCALLAARFGDTAVTSVDIDPYLSAAAGERLAAIGLRPRLVTADATGPLPGQFDRIVSMMSVPTVPGSWLDALRPGGRLVTVLAGTMIIITATKNDDGWATGSVEWDRAGFMAARSGPGYPLRDDELFTAIEHADGESIGPARYPVVQVSESWELLSMLEVTAPGISHYYEDDDHGTRTAWMVHQDGSWARATATGDGVTVVHQGGPSRLWDILDDLREDWLSHGYFQLHGAQVFIPPGGGKVHLARGQWQATISQETAVHDAAVLGASGLLHEQWRPGWPTAACSALTSACRRSCASRPTSSTSMRAAATSRTSPPTLWTSPEIMAVIPRSVAVCNPNDSDCKPNSEVCYPAYCNPEKRKTDEE